MNQTCPNCLSERVATLHRARRAGGAIGMVGGVASALSGARVGLTIGVVAVPPDIRINRILTALLGACAAGVAGGVVGSRLGKIIDDHILHNRRCLACGYTFSADASRCTSTV